MNPRVCVPPSPGKNQVSPSLEACILQLKSLSLFRSLPLSFTCHTLTDTSVSYLDQETMRCFHLVNASFISCEAYTVIHRVRYVN